MQTAINTTPQKWLTWTPRALVILFALFLLMFSFDAFGGNEPLLRQIGGFLIHNMPVFAMLIGLWVAWKLPLLGCFWFAAMGVAFLFGFRTYETWLKFFLISFPMFVIAGLYAWDFYVKRARIPAAP